MYQMYIYVLYVKQTLADNDTLGRQAGLKKCCQIDGWINCKIGRYNAPSSDVNKLLETNE